MLDQLSEGRFELGFGKGVSVPEHRLWGLVPEEADERTNEALALVLAALQSGDRFDFEGRFCKFQRRAQEPPPYQQPYPPLWRPGTL